MLKKILIASVIAASTPLVFAQPVYKGDVKPVYKGEPPPAQSCLLYGPYVGVTLGNRINYTGAPAVYNGIEGDIFAGYEVMNPYGMLALEVFAGDSAKVKDYTTLDGQSIRSTWTYGISFIPGVMIAQNLIGYVRIGYVRTKFRASNPDDTCDCNNGSIRNGWQLGLGGQSNVWDNFDIRGEYIYSQYKSISVIGTPRSHQFNVSLLYRFA